MEEVSGQDLAWFFRQWLNRPGSPELKGTWRYRPEDHQIEVELEQVQPGDPYRLPIEIGIDREGDGAAPDREGRADRSAASLRAQGRHGAGFGRARPQLLGLVEVDFRASDEALRPAKPRQGAMRLRPAPKSCPVATPQIASAILAPPMAEGSISLA